jgi:hypothetical protein
VTGKEDCAEVLMLLASVRGGINGLMAEVLEDDIRLHMMSSDKTPLVFNVTNTPSFDTPNNFSRSNFSDKICS